MDEELQKHLEISRNTKYQWIACIFSLVIFLANGIVFYWIPRLLRDKRFVKTNRFKPYFAFVDIWQTINTPFSIKVGKKTHYFKPSLLALGACFILLNGKLCYIETDDLGNDVLELLWVRCQQCFYQLPKVISLPPLQA